MNRKLFLVFALLALPATSFIGAGAQAAPIHCSASNNTSVDPINDDPGRFIAGLSAKGIQVGGIEDFGGCIRAYITDANGNQVMAYYDPNTLERLDTGSGTQTGTVGAAGNGQAVNAAAATNLGGGQNGGGASNSAMGYR